MPYSYLIEGQDNNGKCCGGGGCDRMDNETNCNEDTDCFWSTDGNCEPTPPGPSPSDPEYLKNLIRQLDKDISENFNEDMANFLQDINQNCNNLGDTDEDSRPYIKKIKKFTSLLDFGDPKNSDELDFIENKIITFLDINNNKLYECFNKIYSEEKFCAADLNVNILLILTILYNKNQSEFDNIKDNDLIKVDTILNRLSKYFPDLFQKILNIMKLCDPNNSKYLILENIYKTMFKYNETKVTFDFNIFKKFFDYLKSMKTIEMIVIIICITIIIAKLISMFTVKVDV